MSPINDDLLVCREMAALVSLLLERTAKETTLYRANRRKVAEVNRTGKRFVLALQTVLQSEFVGDKPPRPATTKSSRGKHGRGK